MKRILTVLTFAALFILAACSGSSNGPINKDSLQGCYELDLSPILKDAMAAKGGEEDMGAAFAQMFLSKLEITVQFEADKAIVDVSGDAMDFIKGMAGSEVELPMTMEYKIENDSVLYLKQEGKDFEKAGVLTKVGSGYDYLKLSTEKNGQRSEIGLKKIK
jgi:hypothetical protein